MKTNKDGKTPTNKQDRKNVPEKKDISQVAKYYQIVVESLRDVIWTVDMELKFTYTNPAVEEILGYSSQDLLGKPVSTIMDSESFVLVRDAFAIALANEVAPTKEPDPPIEIPLRCKDGTQRWVEISRTFLRDNDNKPTGILGVARDINQRKMAEGILRESEYKYRTLVEQSLEGIAIAHRNPIRLAFANCTLGDLLGYSVDEMISFSEKDIHCLVYPDDREFFFRNFDDRFNGKQVPSHYQVRANRKDGTTIWVELSATLITYQGESAIQAAFKDITDTILAQESLHQSQKRYEALFEESNDVILLTDLQGNFVEVNQQASNLLGYSIEELQNLTILDVIHPEEHERCKATMKQLLLGNKIQTYEHNFMKKDGTLIAIDMGVSLVRNTSGNPLQFQAIGRDMTERKRIEVELREREQRVSTIMDSLPFGVLLIDAVTRKIAYANPAISKISGIQRSNFIGSICHKFVCPEQIGKCPIIDLGQKIHKSERILFNNDKNGIPVLKTAIPIVLGEYNYLLEAILDISDRKRAQEELKTSETRLAEAQRIARLGSWDWNIVTGKDIWSDEIYEIFGIPKETVASFDLLVELTHPDDREMTMNFVNKTLNSDVPFDFAHRIIRPDGSIRVVQEVGEVTRNEKGESIRMIGTMQDITDRMLAQEKLESAQAQAEFFTDLMGHDINNLHQGIMIGLELLLIDREFPEKYRAQVQTALTQLERSVSLINNVRRFSGISGSPIEKVNLLEAIEKVRPAIIGTFPNKHIRIDIDEQQSNIIVLGNEFIFDLFYNIFHNSVKFNPNKSVLISVQVRLVEDATIEIRITDYGSGIPDSRKDKVFTRYLDRDIKGSGLGLTIVKQIVNQFGGKIWIEDRIKGDSTSGTTIIIHLHGAIQNFPQS